MTYKGKRPGGASAWQIAAVTFGVLIFMIALSTHTSEEITGTPPAQQIKAALLTSDLDTTEEPEQQDYENQKIEQALCEQGYYRDDVPLPYDLQDIMQSACDCYGVPYSLALAVCQTESSFQPDALNGDCWGYMQVDRCNFETAKAATYSDPETPDGNITCGVYILGDLLARYDTTRALMCYNAGEAGAAKQWAKGITSTEYTRTVLARADTWQTALDR